jgi:hypothetical protein
VPSGALCITDAGRLAFIAAVMAFLARRQRAGLAIALGHISIALDNLADRDLWMLCW